MKRPVPHFAAWLVAGAFCIFSAPSFAQSCSDSRVELRGDWGQAAFSVEVADEARERAQGLMNRDTLAPSHGMLFLFEQPQTVQFWMKDTLIPLDMLFVAADGQVAHIHENAIPGDLTPIPGGDNILAVLEINGGLSARLGLTVGSQLRHPALDQSLALWPCVSDN